MGRQDAPGERLWSTCCHEHADGPALEWKDRRLCRGDEDGDPESNRIQGWKNLRARKQWFIDLVSSEMESADLKTKLLQKPRSDAC